MRYRFLQSDITVRKSDFGSLVLSIMLNGERVQRTYIAYPKKEAIKMFQQEFGTYPKDFKPIGTLCLCNHGGLAIMEVEYGFDDYVFVTDNYGDGYKNLSRCKIYYNAKGEPYFIRNGRRWYYKDFM